MQVSLVSGMTQMNKGVKFIFSNYKIFFNIATNSSFSHISSYSSVFDLADGNELKLKTNDKIQNGFKPNPILQHRI